MLDLVQRAFALHRAGRRAEAAALYAQVLAEEPEQPDALHLLGLLQLEQGNAEQAAELITRAVQRAPELASAHSSLGRALVECDRAAEALPHCETAVRLSPNAATFHHNLGNCLRALGRLAAAQGAYLEALRLNPNLARSHAHLGYVLHALGRSDEAQVSLKQAVALAPDNAEFWQMRAELHDDRDEYAEAIPCWQRVLALAPPRAQVHRALGRAFQEQGQFADARAQFDAALALAPESAAVQVALGGFHEALGEFVDAEAAYRAALRLQPDLPLPLGRLAHLLRGRLPDADRAALEERSTDPRVSSQNRAHLLFGLAHVLDARADYARAAACLREANALALARAAARGQAYVPAEHELFVDGMIAVFDRNLLARLADSGLPTRRPVFVFGLPRSGTSLVEQVLASHPAVYGAGELQITVQTFAAIPSVLGRPGPPLACAHDLTPQDVHRLAEMHLAHLDQIDGGRAARIVDKMPHNYLYVGFLAALCPHATFIHCRRDLRDVAASSWLTGFRSMPWTNDFAHLAARFRQYVRLMQHWRNVTPVPLHEVRYEEFVADLEGGARRLVAACGLDWDPACLEFHRTRRAVQTASFTQVRQPVYTQSVGRWQHYDRELTELFAQLPVE